MSQSAWGQGYMGGAFIVLLRAHRILHCYDLTEVQRGRGRVEITKLAYSS